MISRNEIHTILVSRLRFMGDVILTTPLLKALRDHFPEAKIVYLAEPPYISLLAPHPWVDERVPWELDWRKMGRQLSTLRRLGVDVAIDLFGNPRSAWLTFLSGARIRIGGDFRGRRLFYTHPIPSPPTPLNAIRFHLRYLLPLGIQGTFSQPAIFITEEEKAWAEEYLAHLGYEDRTPRVGLHVGATWPAKRWLPGRFASLARRLHQAGIRPFFTTGPGETALVESVIAESGVVANRPEVLPLRRLASVLACLDLFVSNDCGPMHLAAAVGTKTIGLFGPGEPEIWFPYPPERGHLALHHAIACSRCHRDVCSSLDCMRAIEVEEVFDAVMSRIEHHSARIC